MKNNHVNKAVFTVIKKNIGLFGLLLFTILGVVVASLIPPQVLRQIIDRNLIPKSSDGLLNLAILYVSVIFFIGFFDFFKGALLTVLGQKITKEIRSGMMDKMSRISAVFFTTNQSGAVVSRFTNDVNAINSLFTEGIVGMVIDCFKVFGIVVSISMFSATLGFYTIFLIPLIVIITRMFQRRMLKAQIQNRIQVSKVNNSISESLKNILMIKTFNKEAYMEKRFKEELGDNFMTVEKVNFYDSVYPPIIQVTRAAVIASIVVLASSQLNYIGISLGMIAATIDLFSNLFEPIESLGMELQHIQEAVSGIKRVNDFFAEEEDVTKNDQLLLRDIIPATGELHLDFNNVSFYYREGTDVLQDISLSIHPQEKVTFVGRTGVGKTTLFKLIMGLLVPVEGSITINSINVTDIPNAQKRRIFGYVDQSFPMIKGTIKDQISLKDPDITSQQVQAALAYVGLSDYVATFENGIDTPANQGTLFSQGQKQLLAIARAIVTDPPILLLDEVTANLDSITEERIVTVLQKAGQTHTILSISHRLSSMLASDKVVILEEGKIKNVGTPEMLLENDAWYRSHIELEKLTWN
ncbi:MAG: ABC transporter ATP-binding protein [Erysipelotrichales bacterium]|nr:MAG: ABC transporter ATP-binding protein [Erysipelotrichales bacterium]